MATAKYQEYRPLSCPDCGPGEPLTLYSMCIHVHPAIVAEDGTVDWEPFDSGHCDPGAVTPEPQHRLQCSGCGGEWPVELSADLTTITSALPRGQVAEKGV